MPAGGRPRVVIDTNVFVSGLNFPGRPREVLDLMVKGEIEVMISPFIIFEVPLSGRIATVQHRGRPREEVESPWRGSKCPQPVEMIRLTSLSVFFTVILSM